MSAIPGDTKILLTDSVNWEVGQQIVITTTSWDNIDRPEDDVLTIKVQGGLCICRAPVQTREESHTLTHTLACFYSQAVEGNKVELTTPVQFHHHATSEYQAEVALLSRRITIQGDAASESGKVGGHLIIYGTKAIGRVSGVRAYRMGQRNQLARYSFHFHMMGPAPDSYFQDCSVQHSYYRCFTIHGTNNTRLSNNVAYDVSGHCAWFPLFYFR